MPYFNSNFSKCLNIKNSKILIDNTEYYLEIII